MDEYMDSAVVKTVFTKNVDCFILSDRRSLPIAYKRMLFCVI